MVCQIEHDLLQDKTDAKLYFKQQDQHFTFPDEVTCDEALQFTKTGQVLKKFARQKKTRLAWPRVSSKCFVIDSGEGALKWQSHGKWRCIFFEEVEQVYVLDTDATPETLDRSGVCRCTRWRHVASGRHQLLFSIITFSGTLWLMAPTRHELKLWVTAIEACKWLVMKRQLSGRVQDTFLRHVERHFRITDTKGTGSLSFREITNLLTRLNIRITTKQAKIVFEKYKGSSRAKLDSNRHPEASTLLRSMFPRHLNRSANIVLRSFDTDKNDAIDLMEFMQMLQEFNTVETLLPVFTEYCTDSATVIQALKKEEAGGSSPSSVGSPAPLDSQSRKPGREAPWGWNIQQTLAKLWPGGGNPSTPSSGSRDEPSKKSQDSLNPKAENEGLLSANIAKQRGFIEEQKFSEFLQKVQGDRTYMQKARQVFSTECSPTVLNHKYMSEFGLSRYICSEQNSIYDPTKSRMYEASMNYPLSDYWISCSHNTYLEAGQLVGNSSVSQYFDVLAIRRCRCVELDTWDGNKGEPIITHGYTITKKIRLRDVCRAIKKHAFVTSKFPVILSIEQHCGPTQKDMCRRIFEEEFGLSLLRRPNVSSKISLATPNEAKCYLIIKAKLWSDGDEEPSEQMDKYNKCIYLVSCKWEPGVKPAENKTKRTAKIKLPYPNYPMPTDTDGGDEWKIEDAEFEEIQAELQNRDPLSIVSIGETKMNKLRMTRPAAAYYFNSKFISRIYPLGTRIKSSNLNPIDAWAVGSQMVALNYQTFDKETLKNEGRFRYPNAGCGYVLKPKVLRELAVSRLASCSPIKFEITILSGHGLPKPRRAERGQVVNPFVSVTLADPGRSDTDFTTSVVTNNGFNPKWEETFTFGNIRYPDLAMLCFEVRHLLLSDNAFLAAAAFPLDGIRQGIRWVPLFDIKFTTLQHCGLLVAVKIEDALRVNLQQFFVWTNFDAKIISGTYVFNQLWCESRPVYQKDSVLDKPLYVYFNGDKGKDAGWVLGPEPFEKQTYYAIARSVQAKTPDQVTTPWELARDPTDKDGSATIAAKDAMEFQIVLNSYKFAEVKDSRAVKTRTEVLESLLNVSAVELSDLPIQATGIKEGPTRI